MRCALLKLPSSSARIENRPRASLLAVRGWGAMLWERKARRVAVLNHARNLARSGRYAGWEAIQADTQSFSDVSVRKGGSAIPPSGRS